MKTRKINISLLVILTTLTAGFRDSRIGSVKNRSAQKEYIVNAIDDALITYYAIYGVYPASVDELLKHTEVSYDKTYWYIEYEAFAQNQKPYVRVLEQVDLK